MARFHEFAAFNFPQKMNSYEPLDVLGVEGKEPVRTHLAESE